MERSLIAVAAICVAATAMSAGAQVAPLGTYANPRSGTTTFGSPTNSIPGPGWFTTTAGNAKLSLGASQRYDNPAVTDNGMGTYFAEAGNDASISGNGCQTSTAGCSVAGWAKWNFNYAIENRNSAFTYVLYWDKYNGSNTTFNMLNFAIIPTTITISSVVYPFPQQESGNLGQSNLGGPAFDPTLAGEYTFVLAEYGAGVTDFSNAANLTGNYVSINVTTTPEPSTYALMASGLAALAIVARRRRRPSIIA